MCSLRAFVLLGCVGLGAGLTCMAGNTKTTTILPCTNYAITLNNGSSFPDQIVGCCKRSVSGPTITLGCAGNNDMCKKNKCYEEFVPGGFERSFNCFCSSDNCNPAAAVAALAPLLALPALALLRA